MIWSRSPEPLAVSFDRSMGTSTNCGADHVRPASSDQRMMFSGCWRVSDEASKVWDILPVSKRVVFMRSRPPGT